MTEVVLVPVPALEKARDVLRAVARSIEAGRRKEAAVAELAIVPDMLSLLAGAPSIRLVRAEGVDLKEAALGMAGALPKSEGSSGRAVRIGRVQHPDAWSQRPLWGTNHVVSNVILEKESPNGDVIARSRFHMMELRRDDVRHFAGSYSHHLVKTKEGFRIKLQRVDMTNAQAAYDYVLQVWV